MDHLSDGERRSLWNKVWSLVVPSKVKHLLWRMCHDLLPDYRHIQRNLMNADEADFSFDKKDNDVTHTLLKCEYARVIWFACPLSLRVDDIALDSLSELALYFCNVWDDDALALWSMVTWGLWYNMHLCFQGKNGFHPIELVENVLKELKEFQNLNSNVKTFEEKHVEASWVAPPRGWVKINFHVSRYSKECMGIGCVIRDDMGCVLGSFVDKLNIDTRLSENDAQEIAVYESLLFGLDMGFRLIILELDCQPIVHKLQMMEWETSKLANAIMKRTSLCPRDYDVFVYYISHSGNTLAKSIADFAVEVDEVKVWIDDLPLGVTNIEVV